MTDAVPAPGTPRLLSSLSAAVVHDGTGDLELRREMRGAPTEWGAVIAQCVRLTGAWHLTLGDADERVGLPGTLVSAGLEGATWVSRHRWKGFELEHRFAAVDAFPGVVRTLRVQRPDGQPAVLTVRSAFAPFLLPVLVEGIRPRSFRLETEGEAVRIRQRGFGAVLRSDPLPDRLFRDGSSWIGGRYRGPLDELAAEYTLRLAPGSRAELRMILAGGLDRTIDSGREALDRLLVDPAAAATAVAAADRTWVEATPTLRFPDAPGLGRAYERARAGLRRLYSAPGDGLTGLVAGFPWYAALWGRDLAWMLWAVLWMGDFEWARRSIDSILKFQARSAIPVLGAAAGELPMQVSPGPTFLYGTSDTTLYFPLLMTRWREHSGASLPVEWGPAAAAAIGWGEARVDAATGLFRNGGEAEEILAATASLARVRYGINSPDTTIWDSTDRRAHAVDLQVLWSRALAAGATLLADPADPRGARWRKEAGRVADLVRSRYLWREQEYLYDSIRDGQPVLTVRPNALRAVSAGFLPPEVARAVVARAARPDLTSPWGVRTRSSDDPAYSPAAYHDGQVWTIATAWAADAALAVHDAELGVAYLETIAARYEAEDGGANECYRGDRPEPFDSCFLLGFSVAPFLTVLFERLWGIAVDARAPRLSVRPVFPSRWGAAALENLRIGEGSAALDWSPERLRIRWFGAAPLSVETDGGTATVSPGGSADLPVRARS